MKADLSRRLSLEYENYWHKEVAQVPGAWVPALIDLWKQLDDINTAAPMSSEHRITWVSLRYMVFPASVTVYATPLANIRMWRPVHAMALISALDAFHRRVRETCEECGRRPGFRQKTQLGIGGQDQILCADCGRKLGGGHPE